MRHYARAVARGRTRAASALAFGAFGAFGALGALVSAAACGLDVLGSGPASGPPSSLDGEVPAEGGGADAASGPDGGYDGEVILLPPVDGGTDGPTGLPGFCAGQTTPYFACWDFDDVAPGGDAGFTSTVIAGGTMDVALEGANHVLQATLPTAAIARNQWVSRAITGFGALAPRYELRFVFGVRQSSLAYLVLGALWATTTSTANTFGAASYTQGKAVDMISPDRSAQRLSVQPGPAWHQANVTLVPNGANMLVTVVVDGVTLQDEKVNVGPPGGTSVDVRLGAYYTGPDNGGATLVFDDIVVRMP